MKKISPKQYAVALYQVIKDKQGNQLNQAFDNFLQLVRQNKDWKSKNFFGWSRPSREAWSLAWICTSK